MVLYIQTRKTVSNLIYRTYLFFYLFNSLQQRPIFEVILTNKILNNILLCLDDNFMQIIFIN